MKKFKLPRNFNPGAVPDRFDNRDFKYEDIPLGKPVVDFKKGYNVLDALGIKLKVETQGSSSSCVGQAWSKYAEVLNHVEEKKFVDLSAKSLYEQIFLPSGGAYLRTGAQATVNGGVSLETTIPSYQGIEMSDGSTTWNPPTEEYMRTPAINDEIRKEMLTYKAKEYRSIGAASPVEYLANAIMLNHGAVTGARGDNKGWSTFPIKPPSTSRTWGHAFYFIGFGQDEKGIYFDFINSWGNGWGKGGYGRMYYDEYNMVQNTFGCWTLVDEKNIIDNNEEEDMLKTIKKTGEPEIFFVSPKNPKKLFWIGGWETYQMMVNEGIAKPHEEIASLDGYEIVWSPWGFIK